MTKQRRRPKSRWTAEQWNAQYPVGTPVLFTPVLGQEDAFPKESRKTRSEAWELGHGEPVVMLEGRTGGCALSHCEPVPG